jgi:hypothetical protein
MLWATMGNDPGSGSNVAPPIKALSMNTEVETRMQSAKEPN